MTLRKIVIGLAVFMAYSFTSFAQDVKFGYLNTNEVFQATPETAEALKKIESETKKIEDEMTKMRDELNKKYTAFQQEQETLSEAVKQIRIKEITDFEDRIQTFVDVSRQNLNKLQMDESQPIQEKILKAIQSVGEKNGFITIFEEGNLLYRSAQMVNVTPLVKAELGIK